MKKINNNKNENKANYTINKIFEEMTYAEKYFEQKRMFWLEKFSDTYSFDLYDNLDKILELEKLYNNHYCLMGAYDNYDRKLPPLRKIKLTDHDNSSYDCEFGQIIWHGFNDSKSDMNIVFKSSGDILYTKKNKLSSKNGITTYSIQYNVNTNNIEIKLTTENTKYKIVFMNHFASITYTGNLLTYNFIFNLVDGSKHLLISEDINMSSFELDQNNDLVSFFGDLPASKKEIIDYMNGIKDLIIYELKLIKRESPLLGMIERLDTALSKISSVVPVKNSFSKQKKR